MFSKLFVIVVVLSFIQSFAADCKFEAADGIHYDLSALINNKEDYRIYDYLNTAVNQTFVFNICRNVINIPRDGTGGGACDSTIHDQDEDGHDIPETRPVPAFLVSNNEAECKRVSSPIELGNYNWKYYDVNDKTAGVTLIYSDGDVYLKPYWYHGLILSFRCSSNSVMPTQADVQKSGMANYIIWLDSIYACPQECYPENGQICSGHGICMYDESVEASRCFCNSNNKGTRCEKGIGLSMTNYFMILDIAAGLIVVFTIVYLGCKLRKIRLDPDADVSLDTKFNELGSLAYTI